MKTQTAYQKKAQALADTWASGNLKDVVDEIVLRTDVAAGALLALMVAHRIPREDRELLVRMLDSRRAE